MRLYLRLIKESFFFAVQALVVNKLRTILSLLGVTMGIFSIITVFTLVDALENNIRSSVEDLGDDVVFIQKWPWGGGGGEYKWWEYVSRPKPSLSEFKILEKRVESADGSAFIVEFNKNLKYRNSSIENNRIHATSKHYNVVRNFEIEKGRYFSDAEFKNGTPLCIIGDYVVENLFGPIDPVGKTIKVGGIKVTVIGTFKREGESMIGFSTDDLVLVPLNFARSIVNIKSRFVEPWIMVKADEFSNNKKLKDELTGIMRSVRRLKPKEKVNFALNETGILSKGLGDFFGVVNKIGWIIGGFSLLVGGFSIANIMFVSVKERINIIGIQKALGAKNGFILFQFLSESVFLCLIGGTIGLILIYIGTILVTQFTEIDMTLSTSNISLGLLISTAIGLISGIIPAWSAARLDPVIAIRAKG